MFVNIYFFLVLSKILKKKKLLKLHDSNLYNLPITKFKVSNQVAIKMQMLRYK